MSLSPSQVASIGRHYACSPAISQPGCRTWITRGANFVVAVSDVDAGAELDRPQQVDEYMVYLPDTGACIEAGSEQVEAAGGTLTIVPPGSSRIRAAGPGRIVRVFSHLADDLAAQADNAAVYAQGAPGVAPLVPWPEPVGGFRLRSYVVADYVREGSNMRIFRSTNLMLNVLLPRMEPRDTRKLSPHAHADFEQGSLALRGRWRHHLRYPWTADSTAWREDEHVDADSPSLLVVPPTVIHTSRNLNEGGASLLDIFAPPRRDFSLKPGWVCNADEYPMPPENAPAVQGEAA
jgi:mannose-6-phosphate isomerase-like protein (cupin superfamily)